MNKLEINKNDLKFNINKILEKAKETNAQVIAVVKINAYGLGIVEFSKFLEENGVDFFAVASPEEAFVLRENGIQSKILLMTPVIEENVLIKLIEKDIIITIGSRYEIDLINKICSRLNLEKVVAHLKIDTGFSRYGFLYNDLDEIKDVFNNEKIDIQGMFTHFSKTLDEKWTNVQFDRFTSVIEYLRENNINPKLLHCCNSTAFFKYSKMHLNAVRIGSAWQGRLPNNIGDLKQIGTLKSRILELRTVEKGSNVSYTNKYTTKRKSNLATIPLGYMDGINKTRERDTFSKIDNLKASLRELKNLFKTKRLKVCVNGKECDIVGRLGTLHAIIDVTDIECEVGQEVIINANPVYVDEKIKREYI